MNQNLDLLRQKFCRPSTAAGKGSDYLFPLERECPQGRTLCTKAPRKLFRFQEFSPFGLQQTYRDQSTGLELPLFAVFDLEGKHQFVSEITTDSISPIAEPKSLPSYIPLVKTQTSLRELNKGRMKSEQVVSRVSVILGIFPALIYFLLRTTAIPGVMEAGILAGGWILGAFLIYAVSLLILDRLCPWKKLVLTAEFDGILPNKTRVKARAAKDHFEHLYVVVDQQNRWKSALLPDPRPRALDPLLIGELAQGRSRKFFLIDQFDLTEAEQYLADEFAVKPEEFLGPGQDDKCLL